MDREPDKKEKAQEETITLATPGAIASLQASAAPVSGKTESREELVGKILAQKFELLSFVGSGGMSEVYRAKHLITGKIVAVKIMHEKLARDEHTVRRLKQEAQAAGALSHANILGIHDVGVDEGGTPFLVMDYIDGRSLADIVRNDGPLSLERFLPLMQQVASALAHAKEHNVVHRDLKPSNIMVVAKDGREQAKIVDFGIAKLVDQDENAHRLTQTGELFGSPYYMSPEQCTGAPVTPSSDIYAFGCVMYESISGRVPHIGETLYDTIHRHINEPPPPIVAPQLDSGEKDEVERIILKCLAKTAGDRYQSALEIESELKKLALSGKKGLIGRVGNAWQLAQAKYSARRKSKVPLLVVALFVVTSLSAVSSIVLLQSLQEFQATGHKLRVSNALLNEYGKAFNSMARIYQLSQTYLMTKQGRFLKAIEEHKESILQNFKRVRKAVAGNKHKLAMLNEVETSFLSNYDVFIGKLKEMDMQDSIPALSRFSSFRGMMVQAQQQQRLIDKMRAEETDEIEACKIPLDNAGLKVQIAGLASIIMSASVLITMAIYFVRNSPARLQHLIETGAQLSGKRKKDEPKGSDDDIAGLENLLTELAGALTEAEQREQILLTKLNKQETPVESKDFDNKNTSL